MLIALLTGALAGGCYSEIAYQPGLVYVTPDVGVVVDNPYPVFYADSYFWRYDRGYWYRSNYFNGGWVLAYPTRTVQNIQAPWAYAHYIPYGYYGYYNGRRIYYGRAY